MLTEHEKRCAECLVYMSRYMPHAALVAVLVGDEPVTFFGRVQGAGVRKAYVNAIAPRVLG